MTCLNQQQIVQLGLGESTPASATTHLAECPICRSELDAMQSLVGRLAVWHASFETDHYEARERLLAQLRSTGATTVKRETASRQIPRWLGKISLRQRIALAGLAVAAAMAVIATSGLITGKHLSAMEQMASQIRKIKTVSYRSRAIGPRHVGSAVIPQNFYWHAPGSTRTESLLEDGTTVSFVVIHPAGKAGIEINHLAKTYRRLPALRGSAAEDQEDWIARLGRLSGPADHDLGTKEIDGRMAQGFSIADKHDPVSIALGLTIEAWLDPESRLPVVVDASWNVFGHISRGRVDGYVWDAELDPELFVAEPPTGYTDSTPQPLALAEQCRNIAAGLEFYAVVSGGHYPELEKFQAVVVSVQMQRWLGSEPVSSDADVIGSIIEAVEYELRQVRMADYAKTHSDEKAPWVGFQLMQEIQEYNPDAAYHGMTVRPRHKDQVLFRWKLEDGQYQVIYGDLHFETVTGQRLHELEGVVEGSGAADESAAGE
jgi:hypothetical protein